MPRKRERFDRSDVPRESPFRNVIGAVVCVLVLVAAAVVVKVVWGRVSLESRLGDVDLSDALSEQVTQDLSEGTGFVYSDSAFEEAVLFTTDPSSESTLASARVIAINMTQGTVELANIPLSAKVDFENSATLADVFARSGADAAVEALSAAVGITFEHVVVSSQDALTAATALAGAGVTDVARESPDLLSTLRTDMSASELVSLAETLVSLGAPAATPFDAPVVAETVTDADGNVTETGAQLIDKTQLAIALGLLVSPA